jgi:hypothetical protein
MRTILLSALLLFTLTSIGQVKRFTIQGQVLDPKGEPISDVYIVNLVSKEKDISLNNGVFTIQVLPSDSIVLSHISYFRKIVRIHDILLDPVITLYSENVDIPEVRVTPDQKSELDHANENMMFLGDYKTPVKSRLTEENPTPTQTIVTDHNDQMRVEASSISLVRFSPSENIGKLFTKLKKKDHSKQYSSTRRQLKEVEEKKKKAP